MKITNFLTLLAAVLLAVSCSKNNKPNAAQCEFCTAPISQK